MEGYYLNDVFVRSNRPAQIDQFFGQYMFKNRMMPKKESYRIEDGRVVLSFPEVGFDFYTGQSASLIDYYNARYTDLYSCCFNTQKIKTYLPRGFVGLPAGNVNNPRSKYEVYDLANPSINCTGISENECVFFRRWYCRALRDLVGVDDMHLYDSYCNCFRFHPENRVFIKMASPVNCYDQKCRENVDPILTTQTCQTTTCSNMMVLKDILASNGIKISNIALNLSCK